MNDIYSQFDTAFRGVSAYAILRDGKSVGRIIIKHGTAVTAYVHAWMEPMVKGQARGGGYDRASAAVQAAAAKLSPDTDYPRDGGTLSGTVLADIKDALTGGRDGSRWQHQLEDAGFVVALVI